MRKATITIEYDNGSKRRFKMDHIEISQRPEAKYVNGKLMDKPRTTITITGSKSC